MSSDSNIVTLDTIKTIFYNSPYYNNLSYYNSDLTDKMSALSISASSVPASASSIPASASSIPASASSVPASASSVPELVSYESISDDSKAIVGRKRARTTKPNNALGTIKYPRTDDFGMTPTTRLIVDFNSPRHRERLIDSIKRNDDKIISNTLEKLELDDVDYEEYEDNSDMKLVGIKMEFHIAMTFPCPTCFKKTLVKYASPNMPLIDLVCLNNSFHNKNNSCRFWQVKTKRNESNYFGNKYIKPGIEKYALVAHDITTKSINKDILIGYICIVVSNVNVNKILLSKSYVLIPNFNLTETDADIRYYTYYNLPQRMITWNPDTVCQIFLNNFTFEGKEKFIDFNVNNDYQGDIQNGFSVSRTLFQNKYIKYKKKYISLKKMFLLL
jgi:hypothetical protein